MGSEGTDSGEWNWRRFEELIFSDVLRYRDVETMSWLRVAALCLTQPGMIASLFLRARQCLDGGGHRRTSALLRPIGTQLVGADLSPGAAVGPGLMIMHPVGVSIGPGLTIGEGVTLAGGVTATPAPETPDRPPRAVVEDAVVLGAHVVLVGDVRVGRNAMVGSNSVVMSDVPADAVVIGVPAKKVGRR